MKSFSQNLYKAAYKIYTSIAFYPIIITGLFVILSFFILLLETKNFSGKFIDNYSFLWLKGGENARLIISTIIAGIISLTVFSFSMVMIVLNQATTNFSPRIIPGLISKRAHQIVLGVYLGTIVYSLIIFHNIPPSEEGVNLPQLAIFISEISSIICLSLFVFFIHSISKSIQIDHIIVSIYYKTYDQIKKREEKYSSINLDTGRYVTYNSLQSGYFRSIEERSLMKIAKKNNLVLQFIYPKGVFIGKGFPLLKINRQVNDDLLKEIFSHIIFHNEEYISEMYVYGFKQLSEIAVKALSPGINDPGTALKAIDQLSILLKEKMGSSIYNSCDKENRIILKDWSLDDLLFYFITPIREYSNGEIVVMLKLYDSLKYLLYHNPGHETAKIILNHLESLRETAEETVSTSFDKKAINEKIYQVNEMLPKGLTLSKLK